MPPAVARTCPSALAAAEYCPPVRGCRLRPAPPFACRTLPSLLMTLGYRATTKRKNPVPDHVLRGRPVNRMIRGAAGLTGPLALAAALMAAAAPPAAASAPVNQSYALNAVGHFSAQTIGQATYSGGSPVILPNVDTAGVLRTGIVTDAAGAVSASSGIPALAVVLPGYGSLRAAAVSSSCLFNRKTGVVTGASGITGGQVTRPGRRTIALPAHPAPNTRVAVSGLAEIILNRQYTGPRGTLTAEALWVRMR